MLVKAISLNAKDVYVLYGRIETDKAILSTRAIHKMLPHENAKVLPTLSVVYVAAPYALRERACLRPGEFVLIHSGVGAFGMAAIAVAQRCC